MKNLLNRRNIIIGIVLIIIISIIVVIIVNKNKNNILGNNGDDTNKVTPEEVLKLYEVLHDINCNYTYTWDITTDDSILTNNMSNDILLGFVFKYMENNNLLGDNISISDYRNIIRKVLGNNFKNIVVANYKYKNYIYSTTDNAITRVDDNACNEKQYISSLNGYSYNKESLDIYVNVGYVVDNNVYTVDDKLLSTYNENEIDKILDKSNGYIYTYSKENDNYYLISVKNIAKVIHE